MEWYDALELGVLFFFLAEYFGDEGYPRVQTFCAFVMSVFVSVSLGLGTGVM